MSEVRTFVDAKIAGKRVVVFSKSYCPACKRAKDVLRTHYVGKELPREEYEVIEMDGRDDMDAMQDYLRDVTGARTVPRVFINGKCIGGGSETAAAHSNGKLKGLLAK